jgi:hypothetical protein
MEHDVSLPSDEITLPASWKRLPLVAGVVGLVALATSYVLGHGGEQLAFSYLTGFVYWLTLALGGLFFVLLHFLARSGWSVVVRRLAEHVMATLPLFIVLFIPVVFEMHSLYHWTHAEAVAHDPLLQHKAVYLNEGFFLARAAIYFLVWTALAVYFWRQSARQDESGDPAITQRFHRFSALGMVLFGVTLTFAAFDWIMSLEPHWFSTIFGVYVFAGCVVSIFSLLIFLVLRLKAGGALTRVVTGEHFHDLGKLLFGFVVFWAYIGFSQFMLIWYANLPEETFWFDLRWADPGWRWASIFLAAGHFVVPFFFLISQPVKRNRVTMTIAALWMLFMHYVDIYWLVMPTLHHESFHLSLLDLTCWLGIGGLFLAALGTLMQRGSLVPVRDPRLAESLAFEN